MNEKLSTLLEGCTNLFMNCGIKSLTMNDIAGRLGISKKTLYNYVSDKNDLVYKSIERKIKENESKMCHLVDEAKDAIDELIIFSRFAGEQMGNIHPSIFFDLQKYHPEAWNLLKTHEDQSILAATKANLTRGINEGLYREDINVDVIAHVYLSLVQNLFQTNGPIVRGMSMTEYYQHVFQYHIRGIANDKGIKQINQYLN